MRRSVVQVALLSLSLAAAQAVPAAELAAQAALSATDRELSRSILKELLEINTTASVGSTRKAAEAMAARLRE